MAWVLKQAYERAVAGFLYATEHGYVPDLVLRAGIRYLLSLRASHAVRDVQGSRRGCMRLRFAGRRASGVIAPLADAQSVWGPVTNAPQARPLAQVLDEKVKFVEELRGMPIAINTDEANEQHYEASGRCGGSLAHLFWGGLSGRRVC
eukprot:200775-Chlamydomonas_euryale.AAC.7